MNCYRAYLNQIKHYTRMAVPGTSTVLFYLALIHNLRRYSGFKPVLLDSDHCIQVL
jgi:hypothetical protein